MPSSGQRVATARHLAAAALNAWGVEGDDTYTAVLVVSELVTNAVRHGHVPGRLIELRLTYDRDKTVTVEVSDAHDHRPYPDEQTTPAELAESGRGLALITAFADAWGVRDRVGVGKTVWARLLVRSELVRNRARKPTLSTHPRPPPQEGHSMSNSRQRSRRPGRSEGDAARESPGM